MASRGVSTSRNTRTPLGDATDRVVNTSSQQRPSKPRGLGPGDTNPLRAHPVHASPARRTTTQTASRPSSSTNANGYSGSVNPRASAISHDDRENDKRNSQLSSSSGASAGKRKTHIGPWQLGKTLGKGSAARVRLARHHSTQQLAAVKILSKNACHLTQAGSLAELDKWDRKREEYTSENHMPLSIEREVAILKLIDHPSIMKLYDIWENRSEIYLVLEYVERGDLFEYINRKGPIPEDETMFYFRQILSGLEYCHSFNICHRDLKPENILLKEGGRVKIADFGMAAIQQSPSHMLKTSCGSPHYAAPELVCRKRYRGEKVDVWSLGVILYAMLCARLPFDDPEIPVLLAKATKGAYEMPKWLSYGAQSLIDKMLQVDPKDRLSTRKIWRQPLLLEYDYLDDLNAGVGQPQDMRTNGQCRPVAPEELDMQTLRQLKSMWHTFSEKYLAMKLTSPEPNDQKLFYWLLYNYRLKRLENYDADLTYSASDFHHLRPANWKKKYTTLEFPSRNGRTPSRFTVISNVATDAAGEVLETTTDGGATTESYDPYKSSFIMDPDNSIGGAKIIVHRNGSVTKESVRTNNVGRMRSGSTRSNSTTRGGKHIASSAASRASRRSLASARSNEGASYKRTASRNKRGVDFSHLRMRSMGQSSSRRAASIAGDDSTYERDHSITTSPRRKTWVPGARSRSGTQATGDGREPPPWNDDLRHFTSSIAQDCDAAFNSPLMTPQSYYEEGAVPDVPARKSSQDTTGLSITTSAPTSTAASAITSTQEPRPWDARPLPAAPPPTDSLLHEFLVAQRKAQGESGAMDTEGQTAPDDLERRVVSAPIYSQYSTQWGKDAIPLPSIHEGVKEDTRLLENDRHRVVSAPTETKAPSFAFSAERKGLEFLSQQEKTIRVVTSPSAGPSKVQAPAPLNVRRNLDRGTSGPPPPRLNLRQMYKNAENEEITSEEPVFAMPENSSSGLMKKKSWFKRGVKDDLVKSERGGPNTDATDNNIQTQTDAQLPEGPIVPPPKKKSFSFVFWRNSKEQTPAQLSIADNDFEDISSPEPLQLQSDLGRPNHPKKLTESASNRNIEPRQNWLARLFRVKPAMKYLCFSSSRRRVRQEIAILLKDWRKYGMKDVQVDKKRNIVFARVGNENYLNIKEVSFAAEIMTVIEHGRKNPLSIVRFTQERGAASSFHRVVEAMGQFFEARNLLITDDVKSKMMIKTLNS